MIAFGTSRSRAYTLTVQITEGVVEVEDGFKDTWDDLYSFSEKILFV